MKRKILWILLSFLLVAALVLSSCAKEEVVGEQEEEEEEEEPVGEQEEEEEEVGVPQYGGTYTVLYFSHADAGNADIQRYRWPGLSFTGNTLEFLLRGDYEKYGPRGTDEWSFGPYPTIPLVYQTGNLVESWEVTADKITFHVRPGVMWSGNSHIGMEPRAYTAQDLVFNIRRMLTFPEAAGMVASGFLKTPYEESIYAVGDYTAVVELNRFYSEWWVALSANAAVHEAPEMVEAGPEEWENLVGTGPFMIDEYVSESHLGFVRNPYYWRTTIIDGVEYELPFIDELIMPFIPDESTQLAGLRTGTLDTALIVTAPAADDLERTTPELLRAEVSTGDSYMIALRLDRPPLDDINVRRALMIGTDRKFLFDTILGGVGDFYAFPLSEGIPGYIPLEELPPATQELFEYNPVKAKQMIADAGYPDGLDIVIDSPPIGMWKPVSDTSALLGPMWEEIGVRTELKVHEWVAFCSILDNRTNEMVLVRHSFTLTPNNFSDIMLTGGAYNLAHYSNSSFDELLKTALATVNPDERRLMLEELFLLTLEEVAFIPWGMQGNYAYWWPWVKNYYGERTVMGAASFPADTLWIDQVLKAEMGY